MNKLQKQIIEEKLTKVIQRIDRIEDKDELTDRDKERLTELFGVLEGADEILTVLGYVRRYHDGGEDENGKRGRSWYTLEKIGG